VKRELAQLDMLREEVARIRRMNEQELPAIREARESSARPEDKSPPPSPVPTAALAAAPAAATAAARRTGSPGRSMSPVIAQRLRSFHGARGGPSTGGRESPAPGSGAGDGSSDSSSSSSNATAAVPVRGRLTPPPGHRTVTQSGRASPRPSSSGGGRESPAPAIAAGAAEAAAMENQPQNASRSMSPLIAQRMAAFRTQKT
jgi:hypothetical protein